MSRLYRQAKAQRIPMTTLVNRIVEQALGNNKRINRRKVAEESRNNTTGLAIFRFDNFNLSGPAIRSGLLF
ncbi:MAG: hypothetical protein DMG62_23490 [Acidobacteria bacterium]|nr:MAG: hypothetical protein DMG62_23490 [Acidobacteriota bacterium]